MKRGLLLIIVISCQLFGRCCENNPTVVLIHGFLSSHRSMIRVGSALHQNGCDVYYWNYPSRQRYIQQHGCCLTNLLCEIAEKKPGQPIYFVAHSTGGLILRATLNLTTCPEEAKIGRAVLLAPPNKGAVLARRMKRFIPIQLLMGNKSGKELSCYDTNLVQQLGFFPNSLDVLVIAGCKSRWDFLFCGEPNDGFVAVEETVLETPHRHISYQLTHDQLLKNFYIRKMIVSFILCGCDEPLNNETLDEE